MNARPSLLSAAVASTVLASGAAAQSWVDLGTATVLDISPDGRHVIGYDEDGAYIWTEGSGKISFNATGIEAVNSGGTAIAGADGDSAALYLVGIGGWLDVGSAVLPGGCGFGTSRAYDLSDDAKTAVGRYWDGCTNRAFKWTESGGIAALPVVNNAYDSWANCVSADGSVVGGYEENMDGVKRACIWKADGTQVFVAVSANNPVGEGEVTELSGDGTFAAGEGPIEPFLWTEAAGPTNLGLLPGLFPGFDEAIPYGVSDDGKTVVGAMGSEVGTWWRAFIWTEANGVELLADFLAARGLTASGNLRWARGLSADSRRIALVEDGPWAIWGPETLGRVAVLPEPFTDLGGGSGGVLGAAVLDGTGSLYPGTAAELQLDNTAAGTLGALLVSVVQTPVPFVGGTLHTVPPVLSLPFVTDGDGAWTMPFTWPAAMTPGSSIYFQAAVLDPTILGSVGISNGVDANTL